MIAAMVSGQASPVTVLRTAGRHLPVFEWVRFLWISLWSVCPFERLWSWKPTVEKRKWVGPEMGYRMWKEEKVELVNTHTQHSQGKQDRRQTAQKRSQSSRRRRNWMQRRAKKWLKLRGHFERHTRKRVDYTRAVLFFLPLASLFFVRFVFFPFVHPLFFIFSFISNAVPLLLLFCLSSYRQQPLDYHHTNLEASFSPLSVCVWVLVSCLSAAFGVLRTQPASFFSVCVWLAGLVHIDHCPLISVINFFHISALFRGYDFFISIRRQKPISFFLKLFQHLATFRFQSLASKCVGHVTCRTCPSPPFAHLPKWEHHFKPSSSVCFSWLCNSSLTFSLVTYFCRALHFDKITSVCACVCAWMGRLVNRMDFIAACFAIL